MANVATVSVQTEWGNTLSVSNVARNGALAHDGYVSIAIDGHETMVKASDLRIALDGVEIAANTED